MENLGEPSASGYPFGPWLRAWLTQHRKTQRWLARESGLSVRSINLYVLGQQVPEAESLRKLTRVLAIDLDELMVIAGVDPTPSKGSLARRDLRRLIERVREDELAEVTRMVDEYLAQRDG